MLQSVAPIRRIAVLASACGLATVGALALIETARADDAETRHSCSNATLKGTYAFSEISWSISATDLPTPVARAGMGTFDGNGNMTGVETINSNGAGRPTLPPTADAAHRFHFFNSFLRLPCGCA